MFKRILTSSLKQFVKKQNKTTFRSNFLQINSLRFTSSSNTQNTSILEEVEAKVFQVLKEAAKCNQDKLSRQATFEELGFDSLDSVELVVAMEERFGFDIANDEAEKIQTVNDAITIFNQYMVEKLNRDKLSTTTQTGIKN